MTYKLEVTDSPPWWNKYKSDFFYRFEGPTKYLEPTIIKELEEDWNCRIETDICSMNDIRDYLVFDTEGDATLFLLRWS